MTFVFAFIGCAVLCAIFQFVFSATHWNVQHILIGSIVLGAVLMPFGVTTWMENFGGAGVIATFMDAGAAFAGTLCAGFQAGSWTSFIIIFCIVVAQIPLGILSGMLYERLHPKKEDESK